MSGQMDKGVTSTPYFEGPDVTIWNADARDAWRWLPESSVDAIVTSPPYFGLRDYGVDGQLGLEQTPDDYITELADLFTGYARVLKPGGSLWLNLGDTYSMRAMTTPSLGRSELRDGGMKGLGGVERGQGDFPAKCLLMIPERVALALIERGWILRNRVVWAKPNGMPATVTDRLGTKHEAVFHLVRQPRYFYDLDAIREPHKPHPRNQEAAGQSGVNPGDVWTISTQPYSEAHFAVFPTELVRRPILATAPEGGIVLDPFFGSGTTAVMARRLGRKAWGVELNPDYCRLAASRFQQDVLPLGDTA